jgi:hypothetical protein
MDTQLFKNVAESSARRESRAGNAAFVLDHPHLANDLIALALDVSDKNHFKACWILEIVLEKDIRLMASKLDDFCHSLLLFTNESALRSVAKICMLCTQNLKKDASFLSEKQITQITEACFQWVITEEKVAVKAYAIRALFETGKVLDWVYPELVPVLEHGFSSHSPAYKVVAKEVMGKINKR